MYSIGREDGTNFIPTITIDRKRSELDSDKPRVKISGTGPITLKPLALESHPLAPAAPIPNLRLSDRQFTELESVAEIDYAERPEFIEWAERETVPHDIKPSKLYRYFIYLLRESEDHSSLSAIATRLKELANAQELDPAKVSALAKTVFANRTPLMPQGTKLTGAITTPGLKGLDRALLGEIFSFAPENSLTCVNKQLTVILRTLANTALKKSHPAISRWLESLNPPTINWLAVRHLVQQPNFSSPTRSYKDLQCVTNACFLSDRRLAISACGSTELYTLDPKLGVDSMQIRTDIADKIPMQPGMCLDEIGRMGLSNGHLVIGFTVFKKYLKDSENSIVVVYDTESDTVVSRYDLGEKIEKFVVIGGNRLGLVLKRGIQIRDLYTGQLQRRITNTQEEYITGLVALSNGLFATAYSPFYDSTTQHRKIRVRDSETGALIHTFTDKSKRTARLDIDASNGNLVSEFSDGLHLWNPETGDQITSYELPNLATIQAVLPYGLIALNKGRGGIGIIRLTTGEPIFTLKYPKSHALAGLKIAPDGCLLAIFWNRESPIQYDQIPNLIAAATTPVSQLAGVPQPVLSQALVERRVVVNPESQTGKRLIWIALAAVVSAIVWEWLSHRYRV